MSPVEHQILVNQYYIMAALNSIIGQNSVEKLNLECSMHNTVRILTDEPISEYNFKEERNG